MNVVVAGDLLIEISTEAPHDPAEGKIPAEKIMTDSCGLVNGLALLKITQLMGLPHHPTAFQAQLAY